MICSRWPSGRAVGDRAKEDKKKIIYMDSDIRLIFF